jgi:hypothetical protein
MINSQQATLVLGCRHLAERQERKARQFLPIRFRSGFGHPASIVPPLLMERQIMEPFDFYGGPLKAQSANTVVNGFQNDWKGFPWPTTGGNMAARNDDFAVFKSQQLYRPVRGLFCPPLADNRSWLI